MSSRKRSKNVKIILTCFDPEKRKLLDQIGEDYRRFKGTDEWPENVYGFAYWLLRYSGYDVRERIVEEQMKRMEA